MWSLLITYGVSMIYQISAALNKPFGHDLHDIKLNRLCAKIAYNLLVKHAGKPITRDALIDPDHSTPTWLEDNNPGEVLQKRRLSPISFRATLARLRTRPFSTYVVTGMTILILWGTFIIVGIWALSNRTGGSNDNDSRWWSLYIPASPDILSYVSLGVFLLIGFWLTESYRRYWNGLLHWQTGLRPKLEELAHRVSIIAKVGYWHHRDRERILSHIAALPYASKAHLRGSRHVPELEHLLSPKDLQAVREAPNMPSRICDVLSAYIHHIDGTTAKPVPSLQTTFGAACILMMQAVDQVEMEIVNCDVVRTFPISPAFTVHVQVFTIFWLALLPLTLLNFHGWVSFLYLVPIGYTIIKLLNIGLEMADPFGDDFDDIPLHEFCEDIKLAVLNIYQETKSGVRRFVRMSPYNRERFKPTPRDKVNDHSGIENISPNYITPTVFGTLRNFVALLPNVPIYALVTVILWSVAATFISWGLAKTWTDRGECQAWCSPIDLESSILSKIGVALFILMSFRAFDGVRRYEKGARVIYDIRVNLRSLAVETVQSFKDGHLHEGDKERIVAHLVQIPITFRETLLGIYGKQLKPTTDAGEERMDDESATGLLTLDDRKLMEESSDPVDHLLKTVEAYFMTADMPGKDEPYKIENKTLPFVVIIIAMMRIQTLRQLIAEVRCIKNFPLVGSYTRHQHVMTIIWLGVLPLAMTSSTGFFTILWSSLISFGILGLESIANSLMDPFGSDSDSLDVDLQFRTSANAIVEAVNSVKWDVDHHIRESPRDEEPRIGSMIHGTSVVEDYTLARFNDEHTNHESFSGPRNPRMIKSFYAHVIRSVPTWQVFNVTLWTTFACVLSYLSSKGFQNGDQKWWNSLLSVSPNVGEYVSLGAFTVLGFFVRAAFGRYNTAGSVWGDSLRGSCHTLASTFMSYWPANEMHPGDKARLLGHLAALPVALKCDLRNSRDLRELKGLLSTSDISRIMHAYSMSTHCVTVVRSYYYKMMARMKTIKSTKVQGGRLNLQTLVEMMMVERIVQTALFLKDVPIARGFLNLLNTLLFVFFAILPFILGEITGWFTILWVAVIAYGLLGVYAVASELQQPFGDDLNDLDLDNMTDKIVADVVSVYNMQPEGYASLVKEVAGPDEWKIGTLEAAKAELNALFREGDRLSWGGKLKKRVHLTLRAVPPYTLFGVAAWSAFIVGVAFLVGKHLKLEEECEHRGICSAIAIDPVIMRFVGFALFLLLGFRLNDSHRRYTEGQTLWKDGIIVHVRNIVTRFCGSYEDEGWHKHDRERIAGHLCAFAICLMGQLRGTMYPDRLQRVLGSEDVQKIMESPEPTDYCLDVVRSYALDAERMLRSKDATIGSSVEVARLLNHIRSLALSARACMRLVSLPLAFGYVQHIRILLAVWLALLPLQIIETTGWTAILWTTIIAYCMIAVERWATHLADPFGSDITDIPLEKLCERVVVVTKICLLVFADGLSRFVHRDRPPFPLPNIFENAEGKGNKSAINETSEDGSVFSKGNQRSGYEDFSSACSDKV